MDRIHLAKYNGKWAAWESLIHKDHFPPLAYGDSPVEAFNNYHEFIGDL